MEQPIARRELTDSERTALGNAVLWAQQVFAGDDSYMLVGHLRDGSGVCAHLTVNGRVAWNANAKTLPELAAKIQGGE